MNHCELPAMSVIALAIQPPVHDSAVAAKRPLRSNALPTRTARRASTGSVIFMRVAMVLQTYTPFRGVATRRPFAEPPRADFRGVAMRRTFAASPCADGEPSCRRLAAPARQISRLGRPRPSQTLAGGAARLLLDDAGQNLGAKEIGPQKFDEGRLVLGESARAANQPRQAAVGIVLQL